MRKYIKLNPARLWSFLTCLHEKLKPCIGGIMKSNQERQCRDCMYALGVNGEKTCLLDGLPLGRLFWTHGCTPTNFIHSSEFESFSEERQTEIKEFLELHL